MDLITGLLRNHGYDAILVIVDKFTKAVAVEPCHKTDGATIIATIFYKRIVSRFGMPRKIISDRDPRFTSKFWRELFYLAGTMIAMSSAYHPQSDCQTERTNRTLEGILRAYVNGSQSN